MKDSILKGLGNSRFLKSAVPAGTSWADALAMLQAGTFPIDFNGINNAGFQQVGTPLNKANLLKDATALTLGLTGDATPNDMFNVLAHAGDLHMWMKTVVTKEPIPEVPGSYTLGSAAITNLARMTSNGYNVYAANILVSKEIKVNLDGSVELVSPTSRQMVVAGSSDRYTIDVNSDDLLGAGNRYFTPSEDSYSNSSRCTLLIPPGTVYYVAPGTTYTTAMREIGFTSAFNAAQLVTGVPGTPAIPAGTTVTYPVSTNRNAYQEGDDAKPAGYTLGEVVTGNFQVGYPSNVSEVNWNYSDTLNVADNGTLTLKNPTPAKINTATSSGYQNPSVLLGHFAVVTGHKENIPGSPFADEQIVYIPSNAVVSGMYIDRYQPVTGYAAIPANTTIEYLGCLGDKARVQVVSYVGTGTYGKNNPCSVSVNFPMKAIVFFAHFYTDNKYKKISKYFASPNYDNDVSSILVEEVPNNYSQYLGLGNNYYSNNFGKRSEDRKSYYWYNTDNARDQGNSAGEIYYFLVIG